MIFLVVSTCCRLVFARKAVNQGVEPRGRQFFPKVTPYASDTRDGRSLGKKGGSMNSATLGVMIAMVIGVFTLMTTTDNPMSFLNVHGLLIVIGGTFSVAIIGFDYKELYTTFGRILMLFRAKAIDHRDIVQQLVILSKFSERGQPLTEKSIQNVSVHPFIRDGVRYIENGFSVEEIEDILSQAVYERKEELLREIDIISAIAKYPPAFGMVGTVLGLIALMYGLSDKGASSRLGANMAVALIATLYGLISANYIFQPIGDNLSDRLKKEMHLRRIVIRGIIMLQQKNDPILVLENLNAFLLPSHRLSSESVEAYRLAPNTSERKAA
jgi:chemotaxis protein MotA